MSNSLRPHEPQHARPPCPSPTTRVYPNSCPLSRWCHLTISSSVIAFSSCFQSFPTSGSFPMTQFFALGSQRIGVSASTSVLPMNTQNWPPLGWTGWISLQSKGLSRVFSNTTVQTHQFFGAQLSLFLYFSLISIRLSFFLFAVNVSALFCTLTPYSPLGTYDISVILCFFLTAAFFFLASTHDRVKDPRLTPKLLLTTVHLFVPSL